MNLFTSKSNLALTFREAENYEIKITNTDIDNKQIKLLQNRN